MSLSDHPGWTLFAEPSSPALVWLYVDEGGDIVFECGTCDAWWYTATDAGPLEDELFCEACDTERIAARLQRRRVNPRPGR